MIDKVNMSPSSLKRDFSSLEGSPPGVSLPSLEKENIMAQDDLVALGSPVLFCQASK